MGNGRWTDEPAGRGVDPRELEADHYDAEHVRHLEDNRPVTDDQPRTGRMGSSSDKPGVDGGGYPEERPDEQPAVDPSAGSEPGEGSDAGTG